MPRWNPSSGEASAVVSRRSASSNAPARKLACAAASARSVRRAGSCVSSTARRRKAAAAATPPRACARPADRSSSAATASSGPAAAEPRCHARRSGSSVGSVTSASAAWTWRRSSAPAVPVDDSPHERMPEPKPAARPPGVRRRPPGRPRRARYQAGRRRHRRASGRRPAPPPRRAAAACCRPAAGSAAAGSSPRSRPETDTPSGSPNPPASAADVQARGSSSSASGLPCASATIRSRTALVEPARAAAERGAPAHRLRQRPARRARAARPGGGHRRARATAKIMHDALGTEPARDETQHLRRCLVEPLDVVKEAYQRLRLGDVRQQAQHREPDEEPVRRRAVVEAEGRREGIALRWRQPLEAVEERPAELVEPGEGQLHLGLDARRHARSGSPQRAPGRSQQGGLADAGLAAQDDHAAGPLAGTRDQRLKGRALCLTVLQRPIGFCRTRHDCRVPPCSPSGR